MKKFFTLAALLTFGLAAPVLAQEEEDVTQYIANPSFDEDLTWQADGSKKEIIDTKELSNRSIAGIAADSTVYATVNPATPNHRPDGRTLEATNGFIGRINGWEIVTNQTFPKCEWVYFGSIPYALGEEAIPIADDGSTYLLVPTKPEEIDTEDNVGAAYLRAGWGGRCVYKQEVDLPCAQYRLDYWIRNFNYEGSKNNSNVKNLCKVTCRKEVFTDDEGFSAEDWVKHSIEFTALDKFTIEFGFESSGGSGSNPFLFIDGIKLFKIGEADEVALMMEDLDEIYELLQPASLDTICVDADGNRFEGMILSIQDQVDELYKDGTTDEIRASIKNLRALYNEVLAAADAANSAALLLKRAQKLLAVENPYPGADELTAKTNEISAILYEDGSMEEVIAAEAAMKEAINAYYYSQVPSAEAPADYSFLVENPWFCIEGREPISNSIADVAENEFTTDDKDGRGWTNGSTASGDPQTGAYFKVGRPCYQLWSLNFTGYLDMYQTITDLPNGIYSLEADLITNADALGDQHIYANSTMGETEGYMTEAGVLYSWPSGDDWGTDYPEEGSEDPWETVKTGQVIVTDGTLTIGARSTHKGEGEDISSGMRRGVFWLSNFVLRYYGEASEEQIAEALKARVAKAEELMNALHFNADKAPVADSIAAYKESGDLAVLNGGIAYARTSEAKYDEIMEDGKTIPTVTQTLEEAPEEYGAAIDIVRFALDATNKWIASEEASYKDVDAQLQLMKNYTETYVPAFIKADDDLATITTSKAAKDILKGVMEKQKTALTRDTLLSAELVNEYVAELQSVANLALAQNLYEQGSTSNDYTFMIQNPDLAAETGWNIIKGAGDATSKSGQHYSGDTSRRYIDSYNSTRGALNYYAEQVIIGLPNGKYEVTAAVRAPAEGAFLFTANGGAEKTDTAFVEIPLKYYSYVTEEGVDTTVVVADYYGEIWEEAARLVNEEGNNDPDILNMYSVHESLGYGWRWMTISTVEVKDHVLVIGATTDVERTGKAFDGTWFSVTDWSLTLVEKGNNDGWNGPLTKVNAVNSQRVNGFAIYGIDGRRVRDLNKPGLYIINLGGRTQKVTVK
ncbi:MAG: hypothetical protein J5545_00225 [Bacteroidaceae bacterium]|nr:hypothetical protein [Bacteroidaceae bacterium]